MKVRLMMIIEMMENWAKGSRDYFNRNTVYQ